MANNIEAIYALTPMQEGMYYYEKLNGEKNGEYFLQGTLKLQGEVQIEHAKESVALLGLRHEVLRTAVVMPKKGLKPWQLIIKNREPETRELDLSMLSQKEKDRSFQALKEEDIKRGFQLEQDSLIRFHFVKMDNQCVYMLWSMHHIIVDGWCLSLLLQDFSRFYSSLCQGVSQEELKREIEAECRSAAHYQEYINWLEESDKEAGMEYWNTLLDGFQEITGIEPLNEKKENLEKKVGELRFTFSEDVSNQMTQFLKQHNLTGSHFFETAWSILLSRYNHTDDVVFGKVVSGRNVPIGGIENTVGLFIHTIPVRIQLESNTTFLELARMLQKQSAESLQYDTVSLADMQKQCNNGNPLFDHIFAYENYYQGEEGAVGIDNVDMEWVDYREQTNYNLSLSVAEGKEFLLKFLYDPSIYEEKELLLLARRMEQLVKEVLVQEEIKWNELELLLPEEREKMKQWNQTAVPYEKECTLPELFERQVKNTPDQIAVRWKDEVLTYQQLNEQANRLARGLRRHGVGAGDTVILAGDKQVSLYVGVWGILKAGASYVPVDVAYPEDRIRFIEKDAAPKAVLTNVSFSIAPPDCPVLSISETVAQEDNGKNLPIINTKDDIAYIIYTSGTTGAPKGVMIPHLGVLNMAAYLKEIYQVQKEDVVLQFANTVFDASIWEMTLAWLTGAGASLLAVPKDIISSVSDFEAYIRKYKSTLTLLPPPFYSQVKPQGIRIMTTGGTAASLELAKKALSESSGYVNAYGPTEGTVLCTYWQAKKGETIPRRIPIGKPVANMQVYITNGEKLCGVGMTGEICIAGDGLAKGYRNLKELTREKFVKNPYGEGVLYHTGDLGRWLPDGNIDYVGRLDEQVKVRGFRIELGEIESCIRALDCIEDVAVVIWKDQQEEAYLTAYVVSAEREVEVLVKNALQQKLPNYMVPSYVMPVSLIPLTASGKVNKKALPKPHGKKKKYVAPVTEAEKQLVALFEEILEVGKIGIEDDFFELGGHSLKATRLMNRIEAVMGIKLPLKTVLEHASVQEMSRLLEQEKTSEIEMVPKAEEKELYEMSSAQKRCYMVAKMDETQIAYNVPVYIELKGTVSKERLEQAINQLIKRHEAFRTSYIEDETGLYQKIEKDVSLVIEERDSSSSVDEFIRPFDLHKAPLIHAGLWKRAEQNYLLVLDMHHSIVDGVSMAVILDELVKCYDKEELEPVAYQYKDYSEWMKTKDFSAQKAYWLSQYGEHVEVLNLPLDYKRPAIQSFRGRRITRNMDVEFAKKVEEFISQTKTTEFMVFLAGAMVLLGKYARQEEIIIGTPIAGRLQKSFEKTVGMFVNTLAIKGNVIGDEPFSKFLEEVKETCLNAYENQEYPFEDLAEVAAVNRDVSRNPLFDVMFVMENGESTELEGKEWTLSVIENESNISKFDLTFHVMKVNGSYQLGIEYACDLFEHQTIDAMLWHYCILMEEIMKNRYQLLKDIVMTSEAERKELICSQSVIDVTWPVHLTVSEALEKIVSQYPERTAVSFEGETVTYGYLNQRANQLARTLRRAGVGRDSLVAIVCERSIEMIIAMCGVIKAGGAYVPIDPFYPEDRIQYTIKDSKSVVVLSGKMAEKKEFPVKNISLYEETSYDSNGEDLPIINESSDLLYVIYTSGTTGKPKGVMIEHRNLIRLFMNDRALYDFTCEDNWMMFHSYCFDFSVWEMYGALLYGGKLAIPSKETIQDSEAVADFIEENQITVLNQVPSAFYNLMQSKRKMKSIRYLIFGGEALDPARLSEWSWLHPTVSIVNMYGITETCVHVTYKEIGAQQIQNGISDIGVAIPTLAIYVMEQGKLCGIGVPGELCVAGAGLARGYLNRQELTEEKFTENPFGEGRLYHSGDLARWKADGSLEYLGRIDQQVKIRGFRIELGEITSALLHCKKIQDACVIARKAQDGENSLYAYMVSQESISFDEIRGELAKSLPDYMVPSYMMQLESLPRTSNEKLNKSALPDIIMGGNHAYEEPVTKMEVLLCEIYEEVLNSGRIGRRDSFFECGGHSLKAASMIHKVESQTGIKISLRDVFLHPDIISLARILEESAKDAYEPIPKAKEQEYYEMSPAQKRIYLVEQLDSTGFTYHIPTVFSLKEKPDVERLKAALYKLTRRHEALRTSFFMEQGVPVQKIHEEAVIDFLQVANKKSEELIVPFDLDKAPLMRVRLNECEDSTELILDIHHIIADGMSMDILIKELSAFYEMEELEELSVQYKDYSQWLSKKDLSEQQSYWEEVFADGVPVLNLPLDYIRPSVQQFAGKTCFIEMDEHLQNQIERYIQKTGITKHMFFIGILSILLSKYTRQEDVVIGTVSAGRIHPDVEQMIGMFVNTLPIRLKPEQNKMVNHFFEEVKQISIEAFERQAYPFEELVQTVCKTRDLSRNPLFDVMFTLQEETKESDISGLFAGRREEGPQIAKFDLTFSILSEGQKQLVGINYCTALLCEETISCMLHCYVEMMKQIVSKSDLSLMDVSGIDAAEYQRLTIDFAGRKFSYDRNDTMVSLFEQQVRNTPDAIALKMNGEVLKYRELNQMANAFAKKLAWEGVQQGDYVALLCERKFELVIAMLSVIKLGAAFLPIDCAYPKNRIEFMLKDSQAAAVVTTDKNHTIWEYAENVIQIDKSSLHELDGENPDRQVKPSDTAYIIYTSGTTGKPKGVLLAHQGVCNMAAYLGDLYEVKKEDVVLQFANHVFDASIWEFTLALLTKSGAALCMVEKEIMNDTKRFETYIKEEGVTLSLLPPQYFTQLKNTGLRILTTGGAAADKTMVEKAFLAGNSRYINAYGPTETTVLATHWEADKNQLPAVRIPIGKPIYNTHIYIANGNQLCGILQEGELCIAGESLAKGYLNRPDLTEEKFVKNPFGTGKMYRSGDLARWLPDGNIEYLGRIDQQVKVRGYRIELQEIETVLRMIEGITDAAVITKAYAGGDNQILAYVVSSQSMSMNELREKLKEQLPDYMIPAGILKIDEIPMTKSGKLNQAALPEIICKEEDEYEAPENEMEVLICHIYEEILNQKRLGRTTDFFEAGGHSILGMKFVNLLEEKTGIRISLKDIFTHTTPKALAELLEGRTSNRFESIPTAMQKNRYLMSSAQKRTYLIWKMQGGTAYNMPQGMTVEGAFCPQQFEQAFKQVVSRHEILRTRFFMGKEDGYQIVEETVKTDYTYVEDGKTEYQQLFDEFVKPFDLEQGNLVRCMVVKRKEEQYFLFLDMHHIVGDGISMGIFLNELKALYEKKTVPELTKQYKDYSEWMQIRDLSNQKNYWKSCFQDEIPVLNLPLDYARGKEQSYQGAMESIAFDKELSLAIEAFTGEEEVTEYMVFLSAVMVLLAKYSRQSDILVGTPVSGRTHKEVEKMMGMFVNTLVMRGKPEACKSFQEFVREMKQICLDGYENQEYPFEELVEELNVVRDMARNPLFDVMFTMQNSEIHALTLGGLKVTPAEEKTVLSKFDMTFTVIKEENNQFRVVLEYCSDLYRRETIKGMLLHLKILMKNAIEKPTCMLEQLELIDSYEKTQILGKFNDTKVTYPEDKTMAQLFLEMVSSHPQHTALITLEEQITYKELFEMAGNVAAVLKEYQVGRDSLVAVMMDKKKETVIAYLGVILAGGAYVPIDPDYPEERIWDMLEDCKPAAVLTCQNNRSFQKEQIPVVYLPEILNERKNTWEEVNNQPNDLAYVIYTSGTTGKPKGTLIEQRSVIRLVKNCNYVTLNEESRILQGGSLAFDACTFELWGAWLNGGTVCLAEKEVLLKPEELTKQIRSQKVNTVFITTALFNQMMEYDSGAFQSVSYLMTGGEAMSEKYCKAFLGNSANKAVKFCNIYGPTETTTFSNYYDLPGGWEKGSVPIGKPVSNTTCYVMEKNRLCGIGVPGELVIGGVGVARGYLNRPELTEEKFIKNPFGDGKLYRTGDLACWDHEGNIRFLGRIDEQVKIRGFRVETEEIERVFQRIPYIQDAAVMIHEEDDEKTVWAYYVADYAVSELDVRLKLAESLPEYMIPARMMQLTKIPVTSNGKTDKRALPAMKGDQSKDYIPPETMEQKAVSEAFCQVLGLEMAGIEENFFLAGGDSIKAIRIVSKVREKGYDITVKDVMNQRTVAGIASLAVRIEETQKEDTSVTGEVALHPVQKAFLSWKFAKPSHFQQAVMLCCEAGFQEAGVREALKGLVVHHDMLRAVYQDGKGIIRDIDDTKVYELVTYDITTMEDYKGFIEEKNTALQETFSLEQGPLLKAGLYHTKDGGQLLISIHHMVVDGVSFRVILEDFIHCYTGWSQGKKWILPGKTVSYQEYVQLIKEYAKTSELKEELPYWKRVSELAKAADIQIPTSELEKATDKVSFDTVYGSLTKEQTKTLQKSLESYHLEMNDMLLSALMDAVHTLTGQNRVAVSLEGHGREPLHKECKVDRTVGWFTSIFPCVLEQKETMEDMLIDTKEMLRQIPNHGVGYGILLHENQETMLFVTPAMSFNYLGSFDQDGQEGDIRMSTLSTGRTIAEENELINPINFSLSITEQSLKVSILWKRLAIPEGFVEKLMETFLQSIVKIADYCCEKETVQTLSDFETDHFGEKELDSLNDLLMDMEEDDDDWE